jgi:lysozyme
MDNTALFAVAVPQISKQEGCRLAAYPDPLSGGDPWTIGYGNTGPGIGPGTVWTQQQADDALVSRLTGFCAQLDVSIPWWRSLIIPRQACLLSMCYQLGLGGLMAFKRTLADVQAGNYDTASQEMLQSAWATQTPNRAHQLSRQMATGEVQS